MENQKKRGSNSIKSEMLLPLAFLQIDFDRVHH